ncbi:divisome protein SepX/GlpR [Geodermatophilus sp. URMC 62]|uniref:divisome protein SepX/GlpR n=1 Tax=Geodermatophilus sp. URMC 62 TaxID=3423414 RepID=UPI00406BF3AF
MGSGVLLAALVVLWFVVLVPMVVTRDTSSSRAEVAQGRTLQRRRAGDPVHSAATERVSVDRDTLRRTGELRVDVHAVRRRTLAGLFALTVLALVGALVVSPWLWLLQGLLDVALVGYLVVLRAAARREQAAARRAARAAVRPAARPVARPAARPAPAPRPAPVDVPAVAEEAPARSTADLPHPSLPLAPVHPLRPGRVVAARTPAPAGWQDSAVVGLDDDDIGFADVDLYQPRVVNG